jgi:hypothetical protein
VQITESGAHSPAVELRQIARCRSGSGGRGRAFCLVVRCVPSRQVRGTALKLGDCSVAIREQDHLTDEIAVERVAVKHHRRYRGRSAFEVGDALIDGDDEVVARLDEAERVDVRIGSGKLRVPVRPDRLLPCSAALLATSGHSTSSIII